MNQRQATNQEPELHQDIEQIMDNLKTQLNSLVNAETKNAVKKIQSDIEKKIKKTCDDITSKIKQEE